MGRKKRTVIRIAVTLVILSVLAGLVFHFAGSDAAEGLAQSEEKKADAMIRYEPIPEGFQAEKSVTGGLSETHKEAIDRMVGQWKAGIYEDAQLKAVLQDYLEEQDIACLEISVTSKGYTLLEDIPKIGLADGGNLYSYMGIYSTGEQNPAGTESTVCYQWSVFIF